MIEKFINKRRIYGAPYKYTYVRIFGYCYVVWTAVLFY